MAFAPMQLGHVVMRVRDLDRSVDFYTRIMGLTIMVKSDRSAFMSANTDKSHELAVFELGPDAPGPDQSRVGQAHMAWQMKTFEDLQELYGRLKDNEIRIKHIADHGLSLGVYLFDPDDNEIEIYYELPRSKWQWSERSGPFGGKFPLKLEEPEEVLAT